MNKNDNDNYFLKPLDFINGIPVFSQTDSYINNYNKIASDHLRAIKPGQDNPFIENDLWIALENSTRSLINKYVPPGSRILDVGVGLGRVLGPLVGYERYGIDISFDYLKTAKKAGINVAFSKIEDLPYHDDFFHSVIACDVLEHVLDLHYCSKNIIRVLKPGGILIVRVPFKEDLQVYLNEELPYEFIHLRNFDIPALRLHFGKIFRMKFCESLPAGYYLQGLPRLTLQLFTEKIRVKLSRLASLHKTALNFLDNFTNFSAEEYMNWVYELRDNFPEEYSMILEDIVLPIEVNVVFQKPENRV